MTHARRALSILLVEDNPDDVELTIAAFREDKSNHRIAVVQNGVEAVAYLRQQPPYAAATIPDLILLDLNLPKKTGHEVLAAVKADATLRRIPVVVLTSSGALADVERAYALGANAYVIKPAGIEDLFRVVGAINLFWGEIAILPSPAAEDGS